MVDVERISDHKSPEVLLSDLEKRLSECESVRRQLLIYLGGYLGQVNPDGENAESLKKVIIDFELRAIYPTQCYVNAVKEGKASPQRAPEYVHVLNKWLTHIETSVKFDRGDRPTATIVPFPKLPEDIE